jgi:PLP dependent protein
VTATIADRYRTVVARVTEAAIRARRDPGEVTIVVAAKTFSVDAIREVTAAGARDIGENYVQEARRKAADLDAESVRWHLIGRLQRNKAALAVKLFHLVHSLDRIELARDLNAAAMRAGVHARCLIEVNLGEETTKGGATIDALPSLLEAAAMLPSLEIHGLMAIPPPGTLEESRRSFAKLRALRERLCRLRLPNVRLKELSMGMSADFEAAVEEGATMVRIGTAIFGRRS